MSEQHTAPEQPDSLGRRFRAARMAQRMTLDQMAAITRIQEETLRALEDDRFDRLPPLVFAKGSARSYARALNLDENQCLRLFEECSVSFYKNRKEQPLSFPRAQNEDRRKVKAVRYMAAIVIGVLLLALLRIAPPSSSNPSKPDPTQPASRERVAATVKPAPELSPEPVSVSTSEPASASTPAPAPAPMSTTAPASGPTDGPAEMQDSAESRESAAEPVVTTDTSETTAQDASPGRAADSDVAPLVLELAASATARVVVRADDGEPQEVLLQNGQRMQWRAHDRFLLTLDNAGVVETTLNGRRQGPFGSFGMVVRDIELRP